jgi:iodotyrosine deiodinase
MTHPTTKTIPLDFPARTPTAITAAADDFFRMIASRRSVRHFSDEPVPIEAIERCIHSAAQAPSGANKQPWTFVLVTDPSRKRAIREAAEKEERAFYSGRAPQRWLDDLEPLGTDEHKPFLEVAPALIVIFAHRIGSAEGERNYYVSESVGIAAGFLLAALHHAGLATLTHTPSPMGFLRDVLGRPRNEQAFLLIPVGLPAKGCEVPAIQRKKLAEVLVRVDSSDI